MKESTSLKEGTVVNCSDNHHPGRKSQPKPTDKLEDHMPRKTQQMIHKKQKATATKRLSQFEVSEFLFKNNIHRDTEPFYKANKAKE